MLILRVVHPESAASAGAPVRIGVAGGTIGRAAECTLVLPDPRKHVSRVQAEIRWAGSAWALVNCSDVNPMQVGALQVPPRGQSPLAHGDRIEVADFVVLVEEAPDKAASEAPQAPIGAVPVEDVFAGLEAFAAPSAEPPPAPPAFVAPPAPPPPVSLGSLGPIAPIAPIAPIVHPPAAPRIDPPVAAGGPAAGPRGGGPSAEPSFGIGPTPDRHAPLPRPSVAPRAGDARAAGAPRDADDGLGLDALFGLGGAPAPFDDPLAPPAAARGVDRHPLPPSPAEPGIDELFGLSGPRAPDDPFAPPRPDPFLGGGLQLSSDGAMSDHAPELNAAIRLPTFESPPPSPPPAQAAVYRSWERPDDVPKTRIVGGAGRAAAPGAPGPHGAQGASPPAGGQHARASRTPGAPPMAPVQPPPAAPGPVAPGPAARSPVAQGPAGAGPVGVGPVGAGPIGAGPIGAGPVGPGPAVPPPLAQQPDAIVDRIAQDYRRSFEPTPKTRPTELLGDLNRAALSGGGAGPPGAAGRTDAGEALVALLRGAGLGERALAGLAADPATMQRAGRLLALAVKGTIELLAARARFKHELRATVTTIAPRENNPLKFSPDAAAALAHLLAADGGRGFMAGPAAVRDAFDDLLAHQVAMVAGMRAALQALTARFDPAALEQRLGRRAGLLDSMLPMARKARLWELFGELHEEIARDARDDFEALFGTEFVKAYEAQLDRLEQERR